MAKLKQGSLIGGKIPFNLEDYDKNAYPYFVGNQGTQGVEGDQGSQGVQGIKGSQGAKGVQGNQGSQ